MTLGFLKPTLVTIRNFASTHSAVILTSIGVAGVVSTSVSASVATAKSVRIISEMESKEERELTPKEKVKICWKYYIPTAISGTLAISSIIGSNVISARKEAAIAGAYALAEKGFEEYREQVKEKLGDEEAKKLENDSIFNKIANTSSNDIDPEWTFEKHGDVLCYDYYCGRYFYSDPSFLRSCESEINRCYLTECVVFLEQVYDEIGLISTNRPWVARQLGWELDDQSYSGRSYCGTLRFLFDSALTSDNKPVLIVRMNLDPKFVD